MRRATQIFVLLLLGGCLLGGVLWFFVGPTPSPRFQVTPRRIAVRVQPSLAVGKHFATMVAPDGSLWAWGEPEFDLNIGRGSVPQRVGRDTDWRQVAATWAGFVALKQDGSLWGMGHNGEGLLGTTDRTWKVQEMTRLGQGSDWREIQAGVSHCMGLKLDGSLWTWGQNQYGQIGCGTVTPSEPFTRVGQDTNWAAISPGSFQSYALRTDGTLWMWGLPLAGPVNITSPVQFGAETNWVEIAAGDYHLAARRADGTMWLVGANGGLIERAAQNPVTNWVQIEGSSDWTEFYSGENIIFAKKADGTWTSKGPEQSAEGGWLFVRGIEPLAFHTGQRTSLMLMPDGRLWSTGWRIGTSGISMIEALTHRLSRMVRLRSNLSPSPHNDYAPFLLWTQPEGN